MAVREGFTSADPFSGSFSERMRITAAGAYPRRFLMWCAVLAVGMAVTGFAFASHHGKPNPLLLTWMSGLGSTAAFGAAVYSFGRFALGRELRMLWTAAAFAALASGSLLQAIADASAANSSAHAVLSTASWFVAALFFAASAASRGIWRISTRREGIGMLIAGGIVVAAFPAVASPYAFDTSLLSRLSSTDSGALLVYLIDCATRFVAPVLLTFAVWGYYRKLRFESDRMAGMVCYFLAACLAALIGRLFSAVPYDEWWNASWWMLSVSWVVLIAGAQLETAYAYKDAQDRVAELETLYKVSWSLVGAGTSSELLGQFTRTLVDELGAGAAAVYTSIDDGQKLQLAALCGLDEAASRVGTIYNVASEERRPGFHSGHTAKAFTSTQVQIASDVFVDVEFVPWRVIAQDDGCATSVPLVNRGTPVGVMNLYFGNAKQLTRQRLKLFATIAAAAAPAIESALARDQSADMENQPGDIPLAA